MFMFSVNRCHHLLSVGLYSWILGPTEHIRLLNSVWFWRWFVAIRIPKYLDFIRRQIFTTRSSQKVSFPPFLREGR